MSCPTGTWGLVFDGDHLWVLDGEANQLHAIERAP